MQLCETPYRWKEKWTRRGFFASLFQRKYMFLVAKETVVHSCSSFHPWVTSSADHVRTSRVENLKKNHFTTEFYCLRKK